MGWLSRFSDLVSPYLLNDMIKEFQASCGIADFQGKANLEKHDKFSKALHGSFGAS